MPDDWDDDFGGDVDLEGDELFLDDELDPLDDDELEEEWHHGGWVVDDELDELDATDSAEAGVGWDGAAGVHDGWNDGPAEGGGGGHDGVRPPVGQADRSGRLSWDAWDVGVAFAMGGWLLDQHADRVGDRVRAALSQADLSAPATAGPRGAPHPPPPSGLRYEAGAGTHTVGSQLDPVRVHGELLAAAAHQRGLLLQAEGRSATDGRLVLLVSAVPGSPGPGFWVVAEQHPGGFAASRLVPVFQADPSGAFAVFATDVATEAAEAVCWAVGREGLRPAELTVTRRDT